MSFSWQTDADFLSCTSSCSVNICVLKADAKYVATCFPRPPPLSLALQLLYLASEDPTKDITLYINSPGGSVSAGMAIYDTMQVT